MPCFPWKAQMLGLVLCCTSLQLATPPGLAQTAPVTSKLFIQIEAGEGALNDVRSRDIREPIVRVEDQNHKPIAGAVVIFTSPSSGASASFPNGLTSLQTFTNVEGKAFATGFKPNGIPGSFQIQVQANWNHLTTSAVINETNIKPSSSSAQTIHATRAFPLKAVLIVAAVAGGVAAGVLATRGGSSGTTITAGTPTVGGPPTAGIRFPRPGARN